MSSKDLVYLGHVVPQSYNTGFIALSYLVSLVGAASTLELINRRTGSRGLFNHLLLASSAVTMGGISIWCMHFIGNRAIDLANHDPDLQVAFSSGFTAVSFFVPIIVLLAAFLAIGTNHSICWWRITTGSVLCGAAICGMHYLGNSSIKNYKCIYQPAFIVGAAAIAVFASIISLSIFFVFRGIWAHSWWKRSLSAVILAGAVSGMHWCAVIGTRYRLVSIKPNNESSRIATVIVVICLSLGACFIIAGSAILRARKMRRSALRAQQVTLATAVFDKRGRIMVDPDGLIPSAAITDSFLEKNNKEGFSSTHPVFHWLFQASRNWSGISPLVDGMKHHLLQLPHSGSHKSGIQLVNEHGEIIKDYDIIFRELFCVAALTIAEQLGEHLTSMGVLWDDILSTGVNRERGHIRPRSPVSKIQGTAKNGGQRGGVFAVRAQVDSRGFQVLVHKGVRNVLPSEPLEMNGSIEQWHVEFLRRLQGMAVSTLVPRLFDDDVARGSPKGKAFAREMGKTIQALRKSIKEPHLSRLYSLQQSSTCHTMNRLMLL